jgi:hypothetical protein
LVNADGVFVRKRIASVATVLNGAVLTIDPTYGASDSIFIPPSGATVSPWADGLNDVFPSVRAHFNTLGPSISGWPPIVDPLRQARYPAASKQWPAAVTSQVTVAVENLAVVASVPQYTLIGGTSTDGLVNGVSTQLHVLSRLGVYA